LAWKKNKFRKKEREVILPYQCESSPTPRKEKPAVRDLKLREKERGVELTAEEGKKEGHEGGYNDEGGFILAIGPGRTQVNLGPDSGWGVQVVSSKKRGRPMDLSKQTEKGGSPIPPYRFQKTPFLTLRKEQTLLGTQRRKKGNKVRRDKC